MRKRIVKSRKRIKNAPRTVKKGYARNRADVMSSDRCCDENEEISALTCYEKGEITETKKYEAGQNDSEKMDIDAYDDNIDRSIGVDKREDVLRLVCGFVVIFSIFSAVVLTCFAFAVAADHLADREPSLDVGADVGEDTDTEGGKVIFVRPFDDDSGVLTAPEIYEKCAKSAVTVLVEYSVNTVTDNGIGSGFIITEDGYIATAEHTVRGADKIRVVLSDGDTWDARLVAEDSLSDIALLKIDTKGLAAVEFSSSADLLAGERIYVVGTPASVEYAGTFGSGEISCPNRLVPIYTEGLQTLEKKLRLIQINADVVKGNSGGPIFDEYGKTVGMVTMGLGEEYRGIGFALPSDGVSEILTAMMEGRELSNEILSGVVVMPPKLGIMGETAEHFGVYGYKISGFTDSGSTARGALKEGDLVLEIDKKIITSDSDITAAIEKKIPGDSVIVTVLRSGQRLTFEIILGS